MSIRRTLGASALGLLLAAGACASPDHSDADVSFAQMMIPHHEQAVRMSDSATGRAADPEVRRLATTIRDAQSPEIAQLRGFLREWDAPETPGTPSMPGMVMDPAALDALSGPAFDRSWVTDMLAHHRGAVQMAEQELATGTDPEARTLATSIRDSQSREITEMTALQQRLG